MVLVRQGSQADLAWVLQAAGRSGWEQTVPGERPGAHWGIVAQKVESMVRGALGQPGGRLLVAEAAGTPVGYVLCFLQSNPLTGQTDGVMADLYVEPAWRRRGVGRRLAAAAEHHVRGQGALAMAVVASLYSHGALRLATALGYWPERVLLARRPDQSGV